MNNSVEETRSDRERNVRIALFIIWLVLVLVLASRHVFWRDEVRAFTLALRGDTVIDMLRALHGEGHPALWYLLLRAAHAIVPVREVLSAVAVLVAAVAMGLLAFRSPFRLGVIALIMFGAVGLFEYAVTARNYGISMALLFALADRYPRHRDRGVLLGLLLALLCNTNVPSTFLAAAFLSFWLIELVGDEGLRWTPRYRVLAINTGIAAIGAAACFLQVFPTAHDAAVIPHPDGITPTSVAKALLNPLASFPELASLVIELGPAARFVLALAIAGSLIGLLRSPGAFLSALAVLGIFELFFQLVYPGGYRHQALFLVYLITMYWLVAQGRGGHWPVKWRLAERITSLTRMGAALFVTLLALQIPRSAALAVADARGVPFSRSKDLAKLLAREKLTHAILISDQDMFLEPMPYYTSNPLYFLREQRFGDVVRFTRNARLDLTLDDVLSDARTLQARWRRPVVIVLHHRPDPEKPPTLIPAFYAGSFAMTPDQARRFQAATRKLASFAPTITDESYDVYLLAAGRV